MTSYQKKDLSYYSLRLQEHLSISFPELSGDAAFISRRSSLASGAYEGAFRAGNRIEQCDEIANYILFEGLHFSRFDAVFRIVSYEFDTLMADEELHPFALKMMEVCEPVFSAYKITDDFADTSDFELLYTELTGTIQLWIEEHGLQ
ncbi:uncharacterized protein DUF1896 [Chryseobacterium sp. 52]|uniref:DUF1896 domain-containing protein n=1 Tax=Chryseobacterium sp. 52 TaxID=2035213 RepID=UPI000C1793CE|nr:DUF1896 domain-containing protein [Chryseobacterium sp. 52]PIF45296.1 uncharacterized protein DUF1896 [Chryseobacterium sp. 52]